VAAVCFNCEDWLERHLQQLDQAKTSGSLAWRPCSQPVLVQPHCHQRSLTGTGSLLSLLRRVPGASVEDLDAGCCGLAGAFGYEKEHYAVSLQVAEQRLAPAIRQARSDAAIIAPGFSCRLQIAHCTGRQAVHPAEFLVSSLGERQT
jgi:Fe-S oxidoreductase